jgi:hypothetical protein
VVGVAITGIVVATGVGLFTTMVGG